MSDGSHTVPIQPIDYKNSSFYQQHIGSTQVTPASVGSPEGESGALSAEDPFQKNAEYLPIREHLTNQDLSPDISMYINHADTSHTIPLPPVQNPVPFVKPVDYPTLPLTQFEIEAARKTDVYSALWVLAEWCIRQWKVFHQKDEVK